MENSTTTQGMRNKVGNFITKWVKPSCVPHLLDTDENDGERLRQSIEEYAALVVSKREREIVDLVKKKQFVNNGDPYDNPFEEGYDRCAFDIINIIENRA